MRRKKQRAGVGRAQGTPKVGACGGASGLKYSIRPGARFTKKAVHCGGGGSCWSLAMLLHYEKEVPSFLRQRSPMSFHPQTQRPPQGRSSPVGEGLGVECLGKDKARSCLLRMLCWNTGCPEFPLSHRKRFLSPKMCQAPGKGWGAEAGG